MNLLDAVVQVLNSTGTAMHYKDIARRIIQEQLWTPSGSSPAATVNAEIVLDLRKSGKRSPFQRTGPGVFALREWGIDEYSSELPDDVVSDDFEPAPRVTPTNISTEPPEGQEFPQKYLPDGVERRRGDRRRGAGRRGAVKEASLPAPTEEGAPQERRVTERRRGQLYVVRGVVVGDMPPQASEPAQRVNRRASVPQTPVLEGTQEPEAARDDTQGEALEPQDRPQMDPEPIMEAAPQVEQQQSAGEPTQPAQPAVQAEPAEVEAPELTQTPLEETSVELPVPQDSVETEPEEPSQPSLVPAETPGHDGPSADPAPEEAQSAPEPEPEPAPRQDPVPAVRPTPVAQEPEARPEPPVPARTATFQAPQASATGIPSHLVAAESSRAAAPSGAVGKTSEREERPAETGDAGGFPRIPPFAEVVSSILRAQNTKDPVHYTAVASQALKMGWLPSMGPAEAAALHASVLEEIDRDKRLGRMARFVSHGRGYLGLSEWLRPDVTAQIEAHNREIQGKLLYQLRVMDREAFEGVVGQLLGGLGLQSLQVLSRDHDGGFEALANYRTPFGFPVPLALKVHRGREGATQEISEWIVRSPAGAYGVILSTESFSPEFAARIGRMGARTIRLVNGYQLVNLMVMSNIGISKETVDVFSVSLSGSDQPQS